jgi:tetratricopeptide (TPR) repeat protein
MYLPLMALVSLVVLSIAQLLTPRRVALAAAATAVAVVAIALATLTFRRNLDYGTEERLWADTVQKRPDNPRARLNYGIVLLGKNQYGPAMEQLNQSIALQPDYAGAHLALALALCSEHRIKEAEVHIARSITLGNYSPEYQIKAASVLSTECANRANKQ